MRIDHELLIFLHIVKDGHFLAADDNQLLFFEGMKPANENVSHDSALKLAGGQRGIEDLLIDVGATGRVYSYRSLAEEVKDGGDVMRSKAPKNVFLGAQLPQIQPR